MSKMKSKKFEFEMAKIGERIEFFFNQIETYN